MLFVPRRDFLYVNASLAGLERLLYGAFDPCRAVRSDRCNFQVSLAGSGTWRCQVKSIKRNAKGEYLAIAQRRGGEVCPTVLAQVA